MVTQRRPRLHMRTRSRVGLTSVDTRRIRKMSLADTRETCARSRRAALGSWTWNQAQSWTDQLRWLTAVLTLPERRCPGADAILGPCGHAAEAFLGAPPSHVRKPVVWNFSYGQRSLHFSEPVWAIYLKAYWQWKTEAGGSSLQCNMSISLVCSTIVRSAIPNFFMYSCYFSS